MLNFLYVLVGILILGFVYLVTLHPALTVFLSVLFGLASYSLWKWVSQQEEIRLNPVIPASMAAGGIMLGWILKFLLERETTFWDWLVGPLLALLAIWFFQRMDDSTRRLECYVCRRATFPGQAVSCPRCGEPVCGSPQCWPPGLNRCALCSENNVIRFPLSEDWWFSRVGPRVRGGTCVSCFGEAHEVDLRACGQCHYPMCRRCWDHYDGICRRCEWMIPQLEDRQPVHRYRRLSTLSGR